MATTQDAAQQIAATNARRHAHHDDPERCNYCASFVSLNDGRYYCNVCQRAGRISEWR